MQRPRRSALPVAKGISCFWEVGPTPAVVFTRTLDLSGGRSAIVAVLPQTYPNDSIGDAAVELWKKTGAREVFKLKLDDMDRARAALDRATLIWMPGGFPGLLMKALAGTPIPDVIRRRFAGRRDDRRSKRGGGRNVGDDDRR